MRVFSKKLEEYVGKFVALYLDGSEVVGRIDEVGVDYLTGTFANEKTVISGLLMKQSAIGGCRLASIGEIETFLKAVNAAGVRIAPDGGEFG